jgi:hypothetical protein
MPSTSFTEQQLAICQKHLADFRAATKPEKPPVLAKAVTEMAKLQPNISKKEEGVIAAVSDLCGSKTPSDRP